MNCNSKDIPIITCPVCGTQYMMSEIYMPESFFGEQKEIVKNPDGTISMCIGNDSSTTYPDMEEEFICESCLSKMHIHAKVSFDVEVKKEEDFDVEYSTQINKPEKLHLEEKDIFGD